MLQAPQRYLNFIGNELKPADSGETIPVVDPSNGETFASIPRSRAGDVAARCTPPAARSKEPGAGSAPWSARDC
jgi:aldehyde dehydrogenase (NAD+)